MNFSFVYVVYSSALSNWNSPVLPFMPHVGRDQLCQKRQKKSTCEKKRGRRQPERNIKGKKNQPVSLPWCHDEWLKYMYLLSTYNVSIIYKVLLRRYSDLSDKVIFFLSFVS